MNPALKVGVGVGGGYVLGRRKKMKLAVGLGAWLLGKRIKLDPQALLLEGLQKLAANPDVMKLQDELRGQLLTAARSAATKGLTDQLTAFADALNKQAELARQTGEVLEGTVEDVGDTAGGTVEGVSDTAGNVGETAGDTVSGAGSSVGGALGADEDDEAEDDEAEDEGERAEASQDDEPEASDDTDETEASDDTDETEASADTDGSEQDDQAPKTRKPAARRSRTADASKNGTKTAPKKRASRSSATESEKKPVRARSGNGSSRSAAESKDRPTRARRGERSANSASRGDDEGRPARRSRRSAAAQR